MPCKQTLHFHILSSHSFIDQIAIENQHDSSAAIVLRLIQ
jgi:hypothetical protein